jgi:acetylglutamate kinase
MNAFAGKAFVLRIDEIAAHTEHSTLSSDLAFLTEHDVRPIIVTPNASVARELVRTINRTGNAAVGLDGADAAMLPQRGPGLGNIQPGILETLTSSGYIPVVQPTSFAPFGEDVELQADEVAQAIAAATEAIRAIFFNALGGVPDPKTAAPIDELTPAEALDIASDPSVPQDLRRAIRAAALGVRAGVGAAQIVDGRVAHASIVELLTQKHLGTQVAGALYPYTTGGYRA